MLSILAVLYLLSLPVAAVIIYFIRASLHWLYKNRYDVYAMVVWHNASQDSDDRFIATEFVTGCRYNSMPLITVTIFWAVIPLFIAIDIFYIIWRSGVAPLIDGLTGMLLNAALSKIFPEKKEEETKEQTESNAL